MIIPPMSSPGRNKLNSNKVTYEDLKSYVKNSMYQSSWNVDDGSGWIKSSSGTTYSPGTYLTIYRGYNRKSNPTSGCIVGRSAQDGRYSYATMNRTAVFVDVELLSEASTIPFHVYKNADDLITCTFIAIKLNDN